MQKRIGKQKLLSSWIYPAMVAQGENARQCCVMFCKMMTELQILEGQKRCLLTRGDHTKKKFLDFKLREYDNKRGCFQHRQICSILSQIIFEFSVFSRATIPVERSLFSVLRIREISLKSKSPRCLRLILTGFQTSFFLKIWWHLMAFIFMFLSFYEAIQQGV